MLKRIFNKKNKNIDTSTLLLKNKKKAHNELFKVNLPKDNNIKYSTTYVALISDLHSKLFCDLNKIDYKSIVYTLFFVCLAYSFDTLDISWTKNNLVNEHIKCIKTLFSTSIYNKRETLRSCYDSLKILCTEITGLLSPYTCFICIGNKCTLAYKSRINRSNKEVDNDLVLSLDFYVSSIGFSILNLAFSNIISGNVNDF